MKTLKSRLVSLEFGTRIAIMDSVLILALDTSTPAGSLAVLRDEKVIGTISTWTEETYCSRMFRHLEFLLAELSLGLEAFDLFAIASGPGSFTGLRVGLTAVKGWAEVYRKPIAAISGLEAVAVQARSPVPLLVPVLDARRGQVYFGLYQRTGSAPHQRLTLDGEECVMTPDEFLEILQRRAGNSDFAIVTPTLEVISSAVSRARMSPAGQNRAVEQVSTVLAPLIGQLGYRCAQRGELADSLTLDANYIRRSDAELNWKGPAAF
jgi:tRNA threonylcarbamoyladenosine biosynthesis protein TsaB